MKKTLYNYIKIGCKHPYGDPIPEDTERYCTDCDQIQGEGDCKTDIMCGELCYIIKRVVR